MDKRRVNLNDQVKTDEFAYWSAEYASKTKKIFKNMETPGEYKNL